MEFFDNENTESFLILGMMSMEVKSIQIIDFSVKKSTWECLLGKLLSWGKWEGYKKLFVGVGSTVSIVMLPTQEEYDNGLEGNTDLNKRLSS